MLYSKNPSTQHEGRTVHSSLHQPHDRITPEVVGVPVLHDIVSNPNNTAEDHPEESVIFEATDGVQIARSLSMRTESKIIRKLMVIVLVLLLIGLIFAATIAIAIILRSSNKKDDDQSTEPAATVQVTTYGPTMFSNQSSESPVSTSNPSIDNPTFTSNPTTKTITPTSIPTTDIPITEPPTTIGTPVWNHLGQTLYGESEDDYFGTSISLSSDGVVLAVGAPGNDYGGDGAGQVKVYKWANNQWKQKGQTLYGEHTLFGDHFGVSVSLSSDGITLAVGAYEHNNEHDNGGYNSGQVKVYEWESNQWIQKGQPLCGENAGDLFGYSVSLSGDGTIFAVGAENNGNVAPLAGQAKVFEWTGNQWKQKGQSLYGDRIDDHLGRSVSLSGDGTALAVYLFLGVNGAHEAGQVRAFKWSSNQWKLNGQKLYGDTLIRFGDSVSLSSDGHTLAVGAPGYSYDTSIKGGQVKVFELSSNQWSQKGQTLHDGENGEKYDDFGTSVSLSSNGNILAVGSRDNEKGQTRVFEWISNIQWKQISEAENHIIGQSVSLSSDGTILAVGDTSNENSGSNAGQVKVFLL